MGVIVGQLRGLLHIILGIVGILFSIWIFISWETRTLGLVLGVAGVGLSSIIWGMWWIRRSR